MKTDMLNGTERSHSIPQLCSVIHISIPRNFVEHIREFTSRPTALSFEVQSTFIAQRHPPAFIKTIDQHKKQ